MISLLCVLNLKHGFHLSLPFSRMFWKRRRLSQRSLWRWIYLVQPRCSCTGFVPVSKRANINLLCLPVWKHCSLVNSQPLSRTHMGTSGRALRLYVQSKGCAFHIDVFPCFWLKLYVIWGEVEPLRHFPSMFFFSKLFPFNALKVVIFFLPTCRGSLSRERKREALPGNESVVFLQRLDNTKWFTHLW